MNFNLENTCFRRETNSDANCNFIIPENKWLVWFLYTKNRIIPQYMQLQVIIVVFVAGHATASAAYYSKYYTCAVT